jgi:hypothetical protein
MAYGEGYAELAPQSDTLDELPGSHRNGLIAVAFFGMLSFVLSSTLFLHLTYRLVRWHFNKRRLAQQQRDQHNDHDLDVVLNTAAGERQGRRSKSGQAFGGDTARALRAAAATNKKRYPNQFLVLFYNLLIADIHQAMAFLLNVSWVSANSITVGSTTCWAQGWFVSTGDLASSAFISFIAVHTYLVVVKGCKPPQRVLYAGIVGVWAFVYVMALVGVAATQDGRSVGGFYVRAAAWVSLLSPLRVQASTPVWTQRLTTTVPWQSAG